jgi:N-formylglutamate deformylase
MILPLLISVPHGGRRVPPEVEDLCILTPDQIAEDGDEGAAEIYAFADRVAAHVAADVARAIVDPNRAPDDFSRDGVVKTHTCWEDPVYREALAPETRQALVERYWRPYHAELTRRAPADVILGVDCHTMAATAPPVGPDAGAERPAICLSDDGGSTCPPELFERVAGALEQAFGVPVSRNAPFRGGYIARAHARELPWVQLELSRAPFASLAEKRARVLAALRGLA